MAGKECVGWGGWERLGWCMIVRIGDAWLPEKAMHDCQKRQLIQLFDWFVWINDWWHDQLILK